MRKGPTLQDRRMAVWRMVNSGHAQGEIAKALGVTAVQVSRDVSWLRKRKKLK